MGPSPREVPPVARLVVALTLGAVLAAGCLPGPAMPAGSRELIIDVNNHSDAPAVLEVAGQGFGTNEALMPVGRGRWVGLARPMIVPPNSSQPVSFFVPPDDRWSIYANGGELIMEIDVRGHTGKLPISIEIDPTRQPGWTSPRDWP